MTEKPITTLEEMLDCYRNALAKIGEDVIAGLSVEEADSKDDKFILILKTIQETLLRIAGPQKEAGE